MYLYNIRLALYLDNRRNLMYHLLFTTATFSILVSPLLLDGESPAQTRGSGHSLKSEPHLLTLSPGVQREERRILSRVRFISRPIYEP